MAWTEEEKAEIKQAGKQASAAIVVLMSALEEVLDGVIEDPTILEKYAKVVKLGTDKLVEQGIERDDAIAILTSMLSKFGGSGK